MAMEGYIQKFVCMQALKGQQINKKIRNSGRSSSQRGVTKD